jgi:gliding motility-associated-like protein
MKNIFVLTILLSSCYLSFSQGESNNWIFGSDKAGVTFATGQPDDLNYPTPLINSPSTVVSDSAGNLLFYSDGFQVYNRDFQVMDNGTGILGGRSFSSCVAFAKPGSSRFYFLFTVGEPPDATPPFNVGGRYSIIDMQANGGLGKVTVKNIMLDQGEDAMIKLTATFHKNNRDIWLITECQDYYHFFYKAYLVTNSGIFYKNAFQQGKYLNGYQGKNGSTQLRVSPDGKKMIHVGDQLGVEGFLYNFDNETGLIGYICGIKQIGFTAWGAEFSPSSKYVYLSGPGSTGPGAQWNWIAQYDAIYTDSIPFNNSKVIVGQFAKKNHGWYGMMQCAPDGKIYGARFNYDTLFSINKPDLYGLACEPSDCAYKTNGMMGLGLPQFLTSYAQRFYFTGTCAGEPYQFTSHFFPEPSGILWDFGDGETSTELNPVHIFAGSGNYSVTATVVFPNGSTGEATRNVYVAGLPESALPEELTVCKGEQVTLDAGIFSSYAWSTGDTVQTIMVSDTGYYWVEIVNDTGCMARDTVHIAWFAAPQLGTVPVVSPTTCGSSIGAITGVTITGGSPPYSIRWVNSNGDTIGTTNNLYNLGVDNYYLWVTDLHGCQVQLFSCDIQNYDSDLIITNVPKNDTWCNQPSGSLNVEVQMGLSDRLFYSIDNWATYQTNGSFIGLLPDSYFVKVKDSLDCEAVYAGNPVIIQSLPGLTVTDVIIGEETDNNADGSITIIASGDTLRFSLDGAAPQVGNLFDLLSSGDYTVTVTDMYGCDSTFTVYVPRKSGTTLFASAGDTMVCNGQRGREPLMVNNFKDITSFEITLAFNNLLVDVTGYINADAQIASGLETVYFPSAGTINIKWSETSAVTLPDSTVLLDLIVEGKNAGLSSVDWVETNNQTMFINQLGIAVNVEPVMGSVQIAPSPHIWGFYQENVCEFSTLTQMAIPGGGTGIMTVIWETPKGFSSGPEYQIDTARLDDSGFYRIKVVDQMHCVATDSVEVTVFPLPTVNLPFTNPTHDTIYYEQTFQLETTPGYASYQWNTGDTTYFITVTEEGSYSVIVQTNEGCTSTNSAYLKDMYMPFYFNVPNAFTPDGDGLNDVFRPIATTDLIRQFSLVIYNRWGQLIFETSDYSGGWDGKDAPAGVYGWVISYSNHTGKVFKMRGSVTLLK